MSIMPCPNCGKHDKIRFLEIQVHVREVTQEGEIVYLSYDFETRAPNPKEVNKYLRRFECSHCKHTWGIPENIKIAPNHVFR